MSFTQLKTQNPYGEPLSDKEVKTRPSHRSSPRNEFKLCDLTPTVVAESDGVAAAAARSRWRSRAEGSSARRRRELGTGRTSVYFTESTVNLFPYPDKHNPNVCTRAMRMYVLTLLQYQGQAPTWQMSLPAARTSNRPGNERASNEIMISAVAVTC